MKRRSAPGWPQINPRKRRCKKRGERRHEKIKNLKELSGAAACAGSVVVEVEKEI